MQLKSPLDKANFTITAEFDDGTMRIQARLSSQVGPRECVFVRVNGDMCVHIDAVVDVCSGLV